MLGGYEVRDRSEVKDRSHSPEGVLDQDGAKSEEDKETG